MNLGKETETLEFKKTTGEMNEAMVSIASILNKHGVGTLYFGVKPNGEVFGQDVSESTLRDVSRAVYEKIKPQIYPVIVEEVLEGRSTVKVEFSGESAPYSADGRYYLRTADEDRKISPEELKAFFGTNKYRGKWEKEKSEATSNQIDRTTVKNFWTKAVEAGRLPRGRYTCPMILKRFGLLKDDNLTNAGEVLFGNTKPVTLKVAIFATEEKLTFLDMKLYEDNIFNLMQIAEEYILKNIRWRYEINNMEREEIPEIPVAVIREVLANGFAHAVYNGRTSYEICIHPGKITIYSPGDYASKHKPEEYIKGNYESEIRNPVIAKMLFLSKSIEQFGSGFKRINSLCEDARIKYSYERSDNGFKFIIYRPKIISDTVDVTYDVTYNKSLNETERAVLAVLRQNSKISREEMAGSVSKTVRTVQRALVSLTEKGYIRRVGAKKNSTWEVLK